MFTEETFFTKTFSMCFAHTLRSSTGKPTREPTSFPTRQPTWNPTREPTIAPVVVANTSNATEAANSTIDNVQSDEIEEQVDSADTDMSSLSKNENGAAMKLFFPALKWHSALFGSFLLLL